jgi:hypothetical protein
VIDTADDSHRVGGDNIGVCGAQVVGKQSLEDFVREAIGCGQGQPQGGFVGDARAVEIGWIKSAL